MLELYIDNKLVDLSGDDEIAIDYAIFSFDDINARKGVRSYQFAVPKTGNNRAIFESPNEATNLSEFPYTRKRARCLANGVDCLIRFAEIESANDYYNVRLYGSNTNFYSLIKDKKIIDLDNCNKDHFWTLPNVVDSRLNNTGYIYPLINYYTQAPNGFIDNTDRTISARHLYPALFVEEIIQQIIEKAGYQYNNLDPADETLILPCSGELKREIRPDLYESVHTQTGTLPIQQPVNGIGSKSYYLTFNETEGGCATYWDGVLDGYRADLNGFLLFANSIALTLKWSIVLTNTTGATISGNLVFTTDNNTETDIDPTRRNSSNYYEEAFMLLSGETKTFTGSYDFTTGNAGTFEQNYIASWIEIGAGLDNTINLESDSYLQISNVRTLEADSQIIFKDSSSNLSPTNYISVGSLFDYKQSDILLNYCRLLGLIIISDEVNKKITLQKFDRISENVVNALDWSNKIDLSATPEIKFFSESMAQRNNFVYQVDSPEAQPIGTNGYIEVNNDNLPVEADMVSMDWASCDSLELLKGIKTPTIPCVDPDNEQYSGVSSQRILYLKRVDGSDLEETDDLTYTGISGSPVTSSTVSSDYPLAWFINRAEAHNLGFANSIISERYGSVSDVYDKYKNVVVYLRLNESDINKLDFTKPVYIQHFNAYFYVNKIIGYKPWSYESTQVELVKLY